ncbi:restriction endonuclease subunit S [Phocaeicola plebeius]|uniref:restriction endonuclease subunit S n=1 Tax=Phocaeicola plebeius TaxID=310297 RepID=UPI003AB86DD1
MDTKKLRQKILDLAIRGKLVPQDPNDEPASVLLERIKAEKERLIKEGKIKRSKKTTKTSDTPHYENVPFEIPENWVWTDIENICSKIGSGSTPRGSNYSSKGIPFFRSQNIYNNGLVYEDIKFISEDIHQTMIGTEVLPNDLLLNITGGSLGRCAIVPANFQRGNVSQHVCIMRPILIVSEYFHAFVLSSSFSKSIKITGSGREGLPKYNLERIFFPLPPLTEQYRIVSEIEHWFALINQIEQDKLDLQEAIKQAKNKILNIAIHGKLVPQEPSDEPASELLKRINPKAEITCDNAHYTFKVPTGWIMCKLGEICALENGYAFSSDDYKQQGIPLVRISNISDNTINLNGCVFVKKEVDDRFIVKNGDLLIALSGATTGKMGVYENENIAYLNQRVGNLKIKKNVLLPEYRNYYMFSQIEKILKLAYGGAQPNISSKIICELQFLLPPLMEQKRIVQKIEELYSYFDNIQKALEA